MSAYHEIRATHDRDGIVVYQAYGNAIAEPTLAAGRFVPPFSWSRMTWIKPSFLWLMARSNWGRKSNQEHTLAIRLKRTGWEAALVEGVLTAYHPHVHVDEATWRADFERANVHVQWDPERSLDGRKLEHRAIQVGIGRHLIRRYTDDWIVDITDATDLVRRIRTRALAGDRRRARELLPRERRYEIEAAVARRLGIT